jgi:hypothetical protein
MLIHLGSPSRRANCHSSSTIWPARRDCPTLRPKSAYDSADENSVDAGFPTSSASDP